MNKASRTYSYVFLVVGTIFALLILSASIGVFIAYPDDNTTTKIIFSIVFALLAVVVEVAVYVFFKKFTKVKNTANISEEPNNLKG